MWFTIPGEHEYEFFFGRQGWIFTRTVTDHSIVFGIHESSSNHILMIRQTDRGTLDAALLVMLGEFTP